MTDRPSTPAHRRLGFSRLGIRLRCLGLLSGATRSMADKATEPERPWEAPTRPMTRRIIPPGRVGRSLADSWVNDYANANGGRVDRLVPVCVWRVAPVAGKMSRPEIPDSGCTLAPDLPGRVFPRSRILCRPENDWEDGLNRTPCPPPAMRHPALPMCRPINALHSPSRYPRYPQDPAPKAWPGLISPRDPRRGRKVR